MKNIFLFYVIILAPIGALAWMKSNDLLSSSMFVGMLAFYLLVYRTYTDGRRLAEKKIIKSSEIWRALLPGFRATHFKDLYLR